jgi:hypothetical protein
MWAQLATTGLARLILLTLRVLAIWTSLRVLRAGSMAFVLTASLFVAWQNLTKKRFFLSTWQKLNHNRHNRIIVIFLVKKNNQDCFFQNTVAFFQKNAIVNFKIISEDIIWFWKNQKNYCVYCGSIFVMYLAFFLITWTSLLENVFDLSLVVWKKILILPKFISRVAQYMTKIEPQ